MKRRFRVRKRPGTCPTGKRRYDSQHDATHALANARISASHGASRRAEQRSYECGRCNGGWHLTSQALAIEET